MSDQRPDEQVDEWNPERLARFEEWAKQQSGELSLHDFGSEAPTNIVPIAEGSNGTDAHRLDPFGRGPSSPFYQPRRDDEGVPR